MLMGGHKPPQDVVDFAKKARAADGLAGQVSKQSSRVIQRVLLEWDAIELKGFACSGSISLAAPYTPLKTLPQ